MQAACREAAYVRKWAAAAGPLSDPISAGRLTSGAVGRVRPERRDVVESGRLLRRPRSLIFGIIGLRLRRLAHLSRSMHQGVVRRSWLRRYFVQARAGSIRPRCSSTHFARDLTSP